MRIFTTTLAAIACAFGLTLTGCAPSHAETGVQAGVTTSAGSDADAACTDCAGCKDKAKAKEDCVDCADCASCTDEQKANCTKAKGKSVYPADSAPAKGVPAGSSSAPAKPGSS